MYLVINNCLVFPTSFTIFRTWVVELLPQALRRLQRLADELLVHDIRVVRLQTNVQPLLPLVLSALLLDGFVRVAFGGGGGGGTA